MIVEDHPLMREGITAVIATEPGMAMVAEVSSGREAISVFRKFHPDITLLDLRLPDISGIDVLTAIRSEFKDVRMIVLTTFEGDVDIHRAIAAGARGYLLKWMPPQKLVEAIHKVSTGAKYFPSEISDRLAEHFSDGHLSTREVEVLQKIATGNRNCDIADLLFISEETVKGHVKRIIDKLGANDRTQAVTIAVRRGIFHL
jgi:DNA-binding NarL/FixJ family response regulator